MLITDTDVTDLLLPSFNTTVVYGRARIFITATTDDGNHAQQSTGRQNVGSRRRGRTISLIIRVRFGRGGVRVAVLIRAREVDRIASPLVEQHEEDDIVAQAGEPVRSGHGDEQREGVVHKGGECLVAEHAPWQV